MTLLSTRSDRAALPPVHPKHGNKRVEVLRGEADADTWRIVEAFSTSGHPFELELEWSSGSGAGAWAQLTVARSTRVSLFARSVRIGARNLVDKLNRVGVTVADGFAATRNRWEHRGHHFVGSASTIPIPPFADTVLVELATPALLALATVHVLDGIGIVRAGHVADLQPLGGIPVGGASALELRLDSDADYRAVFHLSL